jgi:hypothetical protein
MRGARFFGSNAVGNTSGGGDRGGGPDSMLEIGDGGTAAGRFVSSDGASAGAFAVVGATDRGVSTSRGPAAFASGE